MSNTNFQTFHQMGNAINDVVRQATGRDNVQNIDMDYVTVAQNKRLVEKVVTGEVASFYTATPTILDYLIAKIVPVQEGTGDPSPENVRPISGWTGANVTRTGKNLANANFAQSGNNRVNIITQDSNLYLKRGTYTISFKRPTDKAFGLYISSPKAGASNLIAAHLKTTTKTIDIQVEDTYSLWAYRPNGVLVADISDFQIELGSTATDYESYHGNTYSITFPTSAGTVYGGELTINQDGSGTLVVDRVLKLLNDPTKWEVVSPSTTINFICFEDCSDRMKTAESFSGLLCSYMQVNPSSPSNTARWSGASSNYFGIKSERLTIEQIKADASDGKIAISYPLATPVTYQITNQQVIETLLGTNNIWADTGDVTVMYKNYEEVI